VSNLPVIKKIAAGSYHSLVLSEEGTVFGFGRNNAL